MTSSQRSFLIIGILAATLSWYKFQSLQVSEDAASPKVEAIIQRTVATEPTVQSQPTPVTTVTKAEAQKFMDDVQNNLAQYNRCYTEDCNAGDVHPRTAYFEAGQKVKAELLRLKKFVTDHNLLDTRISDIAREALENDDGHVQETALDILSTQPISPETLEAILEKVVRGHDAELIAQALRELQRYTSPGDQDKIRNVLAEEMMHGAPFVGQAIARHISLFLNRDSVSFFENIADKIEPGSIIYDQLQISIKEFRRRHG